MKKDNKEKIQIGGQAVMEGVMMRSPSATAVTVRRPDGKMVTKLTPFTPLKEKHPWMGWDRYQKAESMLQAATDDFDVKDCFDVLQAVSQTVCPTVVSMVFDVGARTVYWCENRVWDEIRSLRLLERAAEAGEEERRGERHGL